MNTKITLLLVGVFALSLISLASAVEVNYSSGDSDGIQITMLKYEDYPTNPCEYFDLWIQATLGANVNYAKFQLIEEFPFSIDSDAESVEEFSNYHGDVVIHYKVRVNDDAVEGNNALKIKVSTDKTGDAYVYKTFDIYVAEAQTDFDLIVQESSGTDFSVAIANIGKNTANSLIVRIPQQDGYTISGTNGQMVGNLDAGDYTIVSFTLVPSGKSDSLQVQLDYTDAIGERRSVVKEISYSTFAAIPSGNFSSNMNQSTQTTNTSVFKTYWFWGIVVIILGAGFYFYRRHSKLKSNGKNSPDWVISERTKKR